MGPLLMPCSSLEMERERDKGESRRGKKYEMLNVAFLPERQFCQKTHVPLQEVAKGFFFLLQQSPYNKSPQLLRTSAAALRLRELTTRLKRPERKTDRDTDGWALEIQVGPTSTERGFKKKRRELIKRAARSISGLAEKDGCAGWVAVALVDGLRDVLTGDYKGGTANRRKEEQLDVVTALMRAGL
ncbi:hypothetical protein DPX16_6290 [Anabarilius grahami]|uniref:Uncharacterized protein n=1 Tax=Anabarilius grahami TaxID=495550 RepID=A0A3N0YJ41_ANAGA|nr:hypothetical protein DPX16_6290 [Anabarilius grahami]